MNVFEIAIQICLWGDKVGLAFGVSQAVSIWKIDFDRIGIDHRLGDDGLKEIGFNLGFPFSKSERFTRIDAYAI
jgi:hypothetical protein